MKLLFNVLLGPLNCLSIIIQFLILPSYTIELCEKQQDFVSRDLLEDILEYEEDHVDWIETQQYQIDNMGIENYLQAQVIDGDD